MTLATRTISRYGYLNTSSSAGTPKRYHFDSSDVARIYKWHNMYGNPSYCIVFHRNAQASLDDGTVVDIDSLYLVDNFEGTSEFDRSPIYVHRKKDLFLTCRWA